MALIGNCLDCGSDKLHARGRCTPCYWKDKREALKEICPTCGLSRVLRPDAGTCGMCVRVARPRREPTPRICNGCGRLAIHEGLGLCSRCYQADPSRITVWTGGAVSAWEIKPRRGSVRRLARAPGPLRAGAEDYAQHLVSSKARAELTGRTQLANVTIEARISDPGLGDQLTQRGVTDWAAVAVEDIERFITTNNGQRLATCRGFLAFARHRKLILVNPTATIDRKSPRGFAGRILTRSTNAGCWNDGPAPTPTRRNAARACSACSTAPAVTSCAASN